MNRLPKGFRRGHSGDLACPHRDVSCCGSCAQAHEEIVDVMGQHFWISDSHEREALRAEVDAYETRKVSRHG